MLCATWQISYIFLEAELRVKLQAVESGNCVESYQTLESQISCFYKGKIAVKMLFARYFIWYFYYYLSFCNSLSCHCLCYTCTVCHMCGLSTCMWKQISVRVYVKKKTFPPQSGNIFWEMWSDTEVVYFTALLEKQKISPTAELKYWKLHPALQTVNLF